MRATSAQQGLWFAHRVAPSPDVFTIGQLIDFDGQPDLVRLTAAVHAALDEADGLRSRFTERNGSVIVSLGDAIDVPVRELGGDPDAIDAYAHSAVRVPIDPAAGPCAAIEILVAGDRIALLVVAHHIVLDAYGLGLLVRRVGRLYSDPRDDKRLGSVADLPREPDVGTDAIFWERELDGVHGALTLGSVPRSHRVAADTHSVSIAVPGAGALAMSPERLVAAVAAFCARTTGTDDVVIGFPMMNRFGSPTANVACTTVNVVPLRVAVSPAATADDLAADAADGIRRIAPHARYRGEDIVRDARRRGVDGVVGPTVNVKPFGSTISFGSLDATVRSLRRGPVVDLSITALDLGSGSRDHTDLELTLDADTALYSRADVTRIAKSLASFVAALLDEPTRPVGALRLDDDVQNTPPSGTSAPIDPTPLDVRIAAAPSDAVAVRHGDDVVDYRELNRRADELAGRLGSIGTEAIVAIALPRGVDLIVALLAVMRSGAAFLPLDPGFPADRNAAAIADASPVAVLEQGDDGISLRRLDGRSDTAVSGTDNRDGAAYLIYTSGSTGTPKGVVIPRRALANFTDHMIGDLGLGPGRAVLAVTTISFDIAILETLVPLAAGACVVLASNDDVHDPARLAALVTRHRPDVIQATPSLWSAFLEAGHGPSLAAVDVLVGGEQLPTDVARGLASHARSVRNMYGPTETTIWSTTAWVDDADDITVGTPIANTGVRVLDATLHQVGHGHVGEMYLSGAGVARGYRNRPDLTATRFVADPFSDGARMYRTGDLARVRPDGRVECLGRTDHQVKVRGFRVELGDIETALTALSGVSGAVVSSVDGRLVAYVTADSSCTEVDLAQSTWRRDLAAVLPDYMVPSALVVLDAFPLTPNGKIDRRALPAPDYAAYAARSRPPSSPAERDLAGAFAAVLGLPAVGAEDDFFALGGDSIVAVRVVSAAAQAGWEITPLQVFDHPTVAALATVARRRASSDPLDRSRAPRNAVESATTAMGIDEDELSELMQEDLL
ncbi:non-ribosomal peptide synthetase [Gordonia otitidis]|uniref:Non-ribosomal peptide synthetase n=1 Tax=Gordonia otitidis (strain DSM 44809 / CCUG 52243 / JCM 12355 / NBRC 100426 / IFM 10032) TaxID=1108044 RepID=H5TNF5_GORO1|nr:non-ribosomal peptide synthetase [Gordonia otitidis]GAB35013.1 putative non-ribosomal peptide synthetase [Gordonia otitidis NBRC 100426]